MSSSIITLINSKGKGQIKTIVAVTLLSIFTVFILQNTAVVEIKFIFWHISLSRVLILLGSLFIGFFIGLLFGWETSWKKDKSR